MTANDHEQRRPARRLRTRPTGALLGWLAAGCVGSLVGVSGHGPGWLLLAGVGAIVTVAWFLSRSQLIGLEARCPEHVALHPGQPRVLDVLVHGSGRDVLLRVGEPGRVDRARALAVRRVTPRPTSVGLDLRVAQRGVLAELELEARSTFPFGLFESTVTRRLPCDVTVWPRTMTEGPWLAAAMRAETSGEELGRDRDPAGEFFALREWRAGEPLRRVRWRASLRRRRLLVDERRGSVRAPARVVLVTTGAGRGHAFERAVSATATLVLALGRSGRPVELDIRGAPDPSPTGFHRGVDAALGKLSEVDADSGEIAPVVRALAERSITVAAPAPGVDLDALSAAARAVDSTLVLIESSGDPLVLGAGRSQAARGAFA